MKAAPPRSVYRILVVDDNAAIHEDFKKILGGASDAQTALTGLKAAVFGAPSQAAAINRFELAFAFQGQEGLALVEQARNEGRPFSLAFVDGRMPPGWDGVETIAQFWRVQPDLQVVLCTAYSDYSWEQIRRVLGETDAMVILKKPFDNVEAVQLAHALAKKWDLNRQVQERLADLDRLVRERTEGMRRAMALFDASIAQSPSGILIAEGPEVVVRWANAAALRLVGDAAAEVPGAEIRRSAADWTTFRPTGEPYPFSELPLARAVLRGESTGNEELIIRTPGGEDRWFSVNAAPIQDGQGGVAAGIAVLSDVTERRAADQERERLRAQFIQAQKMESVGRLAGGVAHDFNNMLQAIIGYVELALMNRIASSQIEEELVQIRAAAQRSSDLTRQLLAFARRQTISPRVLDLNHTIAGMTRILERLIGENIALTWKPGGDLWTVKVDSSQIDQILANLVVNSRDAITGPGAIAIRTWNVALDDGAARRHPGLAPGDYVVVAVDDTGCGMDAETRSHLFEPFYTTKGIGKGTGLGLATVFGIVQQNHGFIELASEVGKGTSVQIGFPRCNEGLPPAARAAAAPAPRATGTVLLVEDEPQVLNLSERILTQRGYKVLAASSPGLALELARRTTGIIELLITDVVMPEMNGRELHDRLKLERPETRCLFVSGYTADIINQYGVVDDGIQFLQKPFSVEAFVEKVRNVLAGGGGGPPAAPPEA